MAAVRQPLLHQKLPHVHEELVPLAVGARGVDRVADIHVEIDRVDERVHDAAQDAVATRAARGEERPLALVATMAGTKGILPGAIELGRSAAGRILSSSCSETRPPRARRPTSRSRARWS